MIESVIENHWFCPLFCSSPLQVPWKGLEMFLEEDQSVASTRMWQLHLSRCDYARKRDRQRQDTWKGWLIGHSTKLIGEVEDSPENWVNQTSRLPRINNTLWPRLQLVLSQKQGSSSSRQGDQKTLGTCKSRPGQIHDKHTYGMAHAIQM